jgi:hypothetical protein
MQAHETPRDQQPARDILAAEAFAVPAPDPALRREPLVLPEDPTGVAEPHDILAAEEFAMPAVEPPRRSRGPLPSVSETPWRAGLGAVGALLAWVGLRRRARR